MSDNFKVPQTVPQDLLLIQGFVDAPLPSITTTTSVLPGQISVEEDSISSSGEEEEASEEEIAANLIKGTATDDDDDVSVTAPNPSESDSDSSSDSDSRSESNAKIEKGLNDHEFQDVHNTNDDDDENSMNAPTTGASYLPTQNELTEVDITIPRIDEVGIEEKLEKVGEVMTIVDRFAIVRGLPSEHLNRASERALDSDTLLVFEDRKVMGYIYETFGPTMQPLYQVKFADAFPLDPERVRIGREVFHVPSRSRFVFVSQIKAMRGSDASNMHDEEPADEEIEFSDDEAEAAYRRMSKRKRGESRGRSAASSRSTTPNPAWMRDDELMDADNFLFSGDAYAERGPYDIDYTSLPGPSSSSSSSHPAAIPYDDPYADDVAVRNVAEREVGLEARAVRGRERAHHAHGRGRGRGGHRDRGNARGGGGRGRERDREGRRQGGHQQMIPPPSTTPVGIAQRNSQATGYFGHHQQQQQQQQSEYSPFYPEQHPLSLPSFPPYATYPMMQPASPMTPFSVQPHINPRFASAFGLASPPPPPTPPSLAQQEYPSGTHSHNASQSASSDWTDEWSVPMQESASRENNF